MMRRHCDVCDAVIDPRAARWRFIVRDEPSMQRGLPPGVEWSLECCDRCCALLSGPIMEELANGQ